MLHSKIKIILLFVVSLFLLTLLTSSCLLLRYLPDNEVSIKLFKVVYSLPFGKKTFLEFYSPVRGIDSGYIPQEINQFLIQKIETTTDENEISTIVHFYSLQASGHRIGYLPHISEQAKMKAINQIVKGLDEENLGGKLMMLEELRIGKSLGKGSFGIDGISYPKFSTDEEFKKWFYEQAAPIVIIKYQEWWNSNLSWEEKKKINPLEGTNIKVSHCCG